MGFETLTDLTKKGDIKQVMALLTKYNNYFVEGTSNTRVDTGELVFRLKNPKKIVQRRPYKLALVEREKVKCIIEKLLSHNIIRESSSPSASPVVLVKKKNGDDRLCVDFRELNVNTMRDHFPLPLISDQLDRLAEAKYFTLLDMASGVYQIPIAAESIEKTVLVTPEGQYEYLTIPFGLCNAVSVYQRSRNRALGKLCDTVALVYIDNVLIPGRTFAECLAGLELVLEAFTKAGLSINKKNVYVYEEFY